MFIICIKYPCNFVLSVTIISTFVVVVVVVDKILLRSRALSGDGCHLLYLLYKTTFRQQDQDLEKVILRLMSTHGLCYSAAPVVIRQRDPSTFFNCRSASSNIVQLMPAIS